MLRVALTKSFAREAPAVFTTAIFNSPLVSSSLEQHFNRPSTTTAAYNTRFLSSTSSSSEEGKGIFGSLQKSFVDRQKRKQKEQFQAQVEKMSNAEKWTLEHFVDDMKKTANDWRSKIPGMSNLKQVKVVKKSLAIAEAMVTHIGQDATSMEIGEKLSRADKLRVAIKSEVSVEEVNIMIQQLQAVNIMHQIVRRRKLDGKPLPKDENSMKGLMQTEALQSMTKSQRNDMRNAQMKRNMRGMGRGR